jgi:hypothetical protein
MNSTRSAPGVHQRLEERGVLRRQDRVQLVGGVDVTTQPDGAFIGTLEIDVHHGDHQQERIATLIENSALRAEVLTLRNRVQELEAALNGFD